MVWTTLLWLWAMWLRLVQGWHRRSSSTHMGCGFEW